MTSIILKNDTRVYVDKYVENVEKTKNVTQNMTFEAYMRKNIQMNKILHNDYFGQIHYVT